METKPHDVLATIELYKIRTEPLMREARAWFATEFEPQSGKEIVQLMLSGQKQSAFYRMVASYWETAASFVNNGGIDEKIFLEANTEHVLVYAKMQPFLAEIRELIREPDYFMHVERLVMNVENVETKLENRRRLLARWSENAKAASA